MIETAKTHGTTPRVVVVSSGMQYSARFGKTALTSPDFLRFHGHKDAATERYVLVYWLIDCVYLLLFTTYVFFFFFLKVG